MSAAIQIQESFGSFHPGIHAANLEVSENNRWVKLSWKGVCDCSDQLCNYNPMSSFYRMFSILRHLFHQEGAIGCSNRPEFKLIRPQCDTESLLNGTRAVQGGLYMLYQLSTPLSQAQAPALSLEGKFSVGTRSAKNQVSFLLAAFKMLDLHRWFE